jgi:hypothetical protein
MIATATYGERLSGRRSDGGINSLRPPACWSKRFRAAFALRSSGQVNEPWPDPSWSVLTLFGDDVPLREAVLDLKPFGLSAPLQ